MHNSFLVHMFEGTRDLFHKVPNGWLIKREVLAFFIFDKLLEVTPFSPLGDDDKLVVMNERVNVLNYVRVVKFFHDVYFSQTLFALPLVGHVKYLVERRFTLIFLRAKGTPCSF